MKHIRVALLLAGLMVGARDLALADATFTITDIPGHWYDTGVDIAGTRSLAIIPANQNQKVFFKQTQDQPRHADNRHSGKSRDVESRHTITSLVWPENALPSEKIDQDSANQENHEVTLNTPGLYVFVCKLHPYMLGAVIVDAPNTAGLDLGSSLTLLGGPGGAVTFPTYSDIGLRLLRAFFIVTNPGNWKDYTKVGTPYQPTYPPVLVNVGVADAYLDAVILAKGYDGKIIEKQNKPRKNGIGEVWVDTQFELTAGKGDWFPGTATVVSTTGWNVKRKIALPDQKMNNGHNFWTSHDQKQIYQTEWHGNSVYVLNRNNGKLIQEIDFSKHKIGCHDPAHVMTRVDTQQVHVGCNGDDNVVEFDRDPVTGRLHVNQFLSMSGGGKQAQPHAHWMGYDGLSMVTPNSNTGDSTLFDFNEYVITNKQPTGTLPIATGLMPDSSKYYVSNYLGDTISVMCGPYPKPAGSCSPGTLIKNLNLLDDNADNSGYLTNGRYLDPTTPAASLPGPAGGFSVQTPVSPDGKFVVIGNTLSGTITIIDTRNDTLVRSIPCDPGCHGVNFGAKKGGGYYAYVTSKFANRLIVLDYDPDNDGEVDDAVIAGTVVLAHDNVPKDDKITGNRGMGGQGVMAVPNVYNGWVQELPIAYKAQLTKEQRNPIGPIRKHGHK